MTLQEFNDKMNDLRLKSGMREDVYWPIVYDEDEIGEVLIREDGRIFFADKLSNWRESHLSLDAVSNIRYRKVDMPNKAERDIYVNFSSGDFMKIHNWKKNSIIYTSVTVVKTEENGQLIDELKDSCECYDNIRGNTFYITVRKTEK